jgi:hypothetical protein
MFCPDLQDPDEVFGALHTDFVVVINVIGVTVCLQPLGFTVHTTPTQDVFES